MTYIPDAAICPRCNRILPDAPGVAEALAETARDRENSPDAFCRCDISSARLSVGEYPNSQATPRTPQRGDLMGEKTDVSARRAAGWRPGWGAIEGERL